MTTSITTLGQPSSPTTSTNPVALLRDRFWRKVDTSAGPYACWPWTASVRPTGYGQFSYQGKPVTATRALWQMYHGPLPSSVHVLHHCDNPPCVHPLHLYLGNHRQNMRDMVLRGRTGVARGYIHKGRALQSHCKFGHPYDEQNTYAAKGHRYCRICTKDRVTTWKRAHRPRRHMPDPILVAWARRLREEGQPIRSIAAQIGISHTTVQRWTMPGVQ